jgi:hypothetical protein
VDVQIQHWLVINAAIVPLRASGRLTKRATDGWNCARFWEILLSFRSFPFPSLGLPQPPVTRAVDPFLDG